MIFKKIKYGVPVTVAERSKAWTVFARAEAGTVYSNPTQGMVVYCLCCMCVVLCLCIGRGLAMNWSPVQGVLPTDLDLVTEVKRKVSWRRPGPELGCRAKGKNMVLCCVVSCCVMLWAYECKKNGKLDGKKTHFYGRYFKIWIEETKQW
jgi:hypothetical protein